MKTRSREKKRPLLRTDLRLTEPKLENLQLKSFHRIGYHSWVMWQSRIHTDIKKHLTPHSRRGRRSEQQRAMFGLGTQRGGAKGGMVTISGLRLQFPRRPQCSFLQVFALFLLFLWPVTYLPPSPDRESWRWQDSALQFLARNGMQG
jgi:hypothetical protein